MRPDKLERETVPKRARLVTDKRLLDLGSLISEADEPRMGPFYPENIEDDDESYFNECMKRREK